MKLLKFYAEWCKPCTRLSEMLEDFTSVPVENINVDINQEFVTKYTIRNIPTLILIDDEGKELYKHTGLITLNELKSKIDAIKRDYTLE